MVTKLPQDFKDFLRLLGEHRVEYLLIGGYAVAFYDYSRPTADANVWIAMNPRNAHAAVSALSEFGFVDAALTAQVFLQRDRIVRMGHPPMRLELMTTIDGVDFEACYARRNIVGIDGQTVDLIDLADLRTNKAASARAKDMADLERLPNPSNELKA